MILAIALAETHWGTAGQFAGHNNWGAKHCAAGEECFDGIDHHADGRAYPAKFAHYNTPAEGAAAYIKSLNHYLSADDLASSDPRRVAKVMRQHKYYEAPESVYGDHLEVAYKEVRKNVDNAAVRSYMTQVQAEWQTTEVAFAAAFAKGLANTGPKFNLSLSDFRRDKQAFDGWYLKNIGNWWLSTDEYNACREWQLKLQQWQQVGKAYLNPDTPIATVPDKEKGLGDATADAAGKAAGGAGIGIALLIGGGVAAYLLTKGK